jgi:hypothetical protein
MNWDEIQKAKQAHRAMLRARSAPEKIKLLERLKSRSKAVRNARSAHRHAGRIMSDWTMQHDSAGRWSVARSVRDGKPVSTAGSLVDSVSRVNVSRAKTLEPPPKDESAA